MKEHAEPIIYLSFNRGSHVNKTGTEGSILCVAVSSSSLNGLHCWVVEIMIFVFRSIGSNHLWNLIWISVPYYCFSPPRRSGAFSSPSSDHSDLVHISESVFCKETPASLWNFAIFLSKILVDKFHLLKKFHFLCLCLCFIHSTYWDFCNRILQYLCL